MTTKELIAAFEQAARANREDICRNGNIICLDRPGEVIMTGDLHGHDRNLDRLVSIARLEENPNRHLVIHEILHCSDSDDLLDECRSYVLAAKAAQLKVRFPHQVHWLLGNHAIAQLTREEVLKSGRPMVRALNTAIYSDCGDSAGLVMQALDQFILSMPLAARCGNRIWLSHSVPDGRHLVRFDDFIFEKTLTLEDLRSNHSLHALTWDRRQTEKSLEKLSEMWDADVFVVGHQPQPDGCSRPFDRLIILASDHNHGCYLRFGLDIEYTPMELYDCVRPLAEIE